MPAERSRPFACWTAVVEKALLPDVRPERSTYVLGLDLCAAMVEAIQQRQSEREEYRVADVQNLGFLNPTFSIFCVSYYNRCKSSVDGKTYNGIELWMSFPIGAVRKKSQIMKSCPFILLLLLLLLLLLCSLSCKKEMTTQPSPTPRQKWQSFAIHDYSAVQTRSCFCIHGGEKMRITVLSDTIHSVMRISDGYALPCSESKAYMSIEQLFEYIDHSQDSLIIKYNDHYGYPEMLDINPQLNPVDGGALYETTDLQKN